jgi:inner membrane transporter RhtA
MVLGGACSIQFGSALAIGLFEEVGPAGTVFLRLVISAILLAILWKPVYLIDRARYKLVVSFGLALAGMAFCFYQSLDRIPLGTAVTLEFVGPLGVALFTSYRRRDLIWVALAAIGIILLSGGFGGESLDPLGVLWALLAGLSWGAYILLGKDVGEEWTGGRGLALAMVPAALVCAPFGITDGGAQLLNPATLTLGIAVAVLSTTLPFSLEMEALRRLPAHAFGILMSLEPAIATIAGYLFLAQGLAFMQILAVALVVIASLGTLWNGPLNMPLPQ